MNRTILRPQTVLQYTSRLAVLAIGFGAFAVVGAVPVLAQDHRDGQRDNGRYENEERHSPPKHVPVRRNDRPSYGYGHPAYVYAPPPVVYATPPALEFVFPFNIR